MRDGEWLVEGEPDSVRDTRAVRLGLGDCEGEGDARGEPDTRAEAEGEADTETQPV